MSDTNVFRLNPDRHEHCEACGRDMPVRALTAFNPEEDVTQYLCRDYISCGERVLYGQEGALLPIHAGTVARKLAAEIREAITRGADTPTVAEIANRVEHVARVLAAYNARQVAGVGFERRPAWAAETQRVLPSTNAWRDLVARVERLEGWAEDVSAWMGREGTRPADNDATAVIPRIVP